MAIWDMLLEVLWFKFQAKEIANALWKSDNTNMQGLWSRDLSRARESFWEQGHWEQDLNQASDGSLKDGDNR